MLELLILVLFAAIAVGSFFIMLNLIRKDTGSSDMGVGTLCICGFAAIHVPNAIVTLLSTFVKGLAILIL